MDKSNKRAVRITCPVGFVKEVIPPKGYILIEYDDGSSEKVLGNEIDMVVPSGLLFPPASIVHLLFILAGIQAELRERHSLAPPGTVAVVKARLGL